MVHTPRLFIQYKGDNVPTYLSGTLGQHVPPMRLVSKRTQEYAGACPFCGGDERRSDRFHIWLQPIGRERFWCRRCNRKGRANELSGIQNSPNSFQQREAKPPSQTPSPQAHHIEQYRQLYAVVAAWAETNLHQDWNPEPLDYLRRRGLGDALIREARLGFALRDSHSLLGHLGRYAASLLPYVEEAGVLTRDDQGALRTHPNLCGRIVIPYRSQGEVLDLRTRRFPSKGYTSLPGGYTQRGATLPLNWDATALNEVIIVTEGEFKALAVTAAYNAGMFPYPAISHPGLNYFRSEWATEMVRRGVRVVILAYDARSVRPRDEQGAEQLAPEEYWTIRHGATLRNAGLHVLVLQLPIPSDADKEDLDGFLSKRSLHALAHLLHTTVLPLQVYFEQLPHNLVVHAGLDQFLSR